MQECLYVFPAALWVASFGWLWLLQHCLDY